MILKNAVVLDGAFVFRKVDVRVENQIITQMAEGIDDYNDITLDFTDKFIIPGLIDTHFHGAVGKVYLDMTPGVCEEISEYQARHGTTTICPALSAAPTDKMLKAIEFIVKNKKKSKYAKLLGIHLEGPFFSETFKGAHSTENIRNSNLKEFKLLVEKGEGMVKIITMAPELRGSKSVIEYAKEIGVKVSIGHTNATYEEVNKAQKWGASRATHTFNAMNPLNHRNPGAVGGVLMNTDINCEVICDFVHLHPDVVKMIYKVKGPDNMTVVTDSELGAGMPDGTYTVNGHDIIVEYPRTFLPNGTLAGGNSCMMDCVKNLIKIGIPSNDAVKMASLNPAKAIGMDGDIGSITRGKHADILVVDKKFNVENCFIDGKMCF